MPSSYAAPASQHSNRLPGRRAGTEPDASAGGHSGLGTASTLWLSRGPTSEPTRLGSSGDGISFGASAKQDGADSTMAESTSFMTSTAFQNSSTRLSLSTMRSVHSNTTQGSSSMTPPPVNSSGADPAAVDAPSNSLSEGATAAIIIGIILVVAACIYAVWALVQNRRSAGRPGSPSFSLDTPYDGALPLRDVGRKDGRAAASGLEAWLAVNDDGWPPAHLPSRTGPSEAQPFARTGRRSGRGDGRPRYAESGSSCRTARSAPRPRPALEAGRLREWDASSSVEATGHHSVRGGMCGRNQSSH
ncbi:hypothetical protein RJ55_08583 [Drechmeria coniospora]|nr:hypothetical protein RJ55_08583 [Drechmeria coniospora]